MEDLVKKVFHICSVYKFHFKLPDMKAFLGQLHSHKLSIGTLSMLLYKINIDPNMFAALSDLPDSGIKLGVHYKCKNYYIGIECLKILQLCIRQLDSRDLKVAIEKMGISITFAPINVSAPKEYYKTGLFIGYFRPISDMDNLVIICTNYYAKHYRIKCEMDYYSIINAIQSAKDKCRDLNEGYSLMFMIEDRPAMVIIDGRPITIEKEKKFVIPERIPVKYICQYGRNCVKGVCLSEHCNVDCTYCNYYFSPEHIMRFHPDPTAILSNMCVKRIIPEKTERLYGQSVIVRPSGDFVAKRAKIN